MVDREKEGGGGRTIEIHHIIELFLKGMFYTNEISCQIVISVQTRQKIQPKLRVFHNKTFRLIKLIKLVALVYFEFLLLSTICMSFFHWLIPYLFFHIFPPLYFPLKSNYIYQSISYSFSMGYNGRSCILRALCESAQYFMGKATNMVEELVRLVLT